MILSGKELSAIVREEVKQKTEVFFKKAGRKPTLAVVLVGNDPASQTYVKGKKAACEEIGFEHLDYKFDEKYSEPELLKLVSELNSNKNVDGILIQLPLPKHIDEIKVINSIVPDKDVDGFTPSNIGKVLLGQKALISCTPKGILRIIDHYGIDTQSKDVCIVGRSNIVGKPMAALLEQKDRNSTVTLCHSKTKNLPEYTKRADILIAAVGKVNSITPEMVKDGAIVIDVGINRVEDKSKKSGFALKGDVDFEGVSKKAGSITPVPGGVGPMTISMLMENTLIAACDHCGLEMEKL